MRCCFAHRVNQRGGCPIAAHREDVGDRVVLGAGAKVLGDITVGADSQVGANSVLLRSVGERSVVVGIPGRVISRDGIPVDDGRTADDEVADVLTSLIARVDELERLALSGSLLQCSL